VDITDFEINMFGAAPATRTPLDGGGAVLENHCWLLSVKVETRQDTTEPYHVLGTTLSSNVFCLCSGKRDVALILLVQWCYALLRMRPLSISCAEGCVVIFCGKVDYDKSGWRVD
jgi:hypothetical protein